MTAKTAQQGVHIERHLKAPPEVVFDAWTNPESLAVWMCPGEILRTEATIDPRVGGAFVIRMIGNENTFEHRGVIKELDRPRRLALTWRSQFTEGRDTLVTIELTAEKDGTRLCLTHTELPSREEIESHHNGWDQVLAKLGATLQQAA